MSMQSPESKANPIMQPTATPDDNTTINQMKNNNNRTPTHNTGPHMHAINTNPTDEERKYENH
jgi:hypothetical protein